LEFCVHDAPGADPDAELASCTQITACPPLAARSQPDPELGVGMPTGVGT
jgi:hypothetical protein